MKTIAEGYEGCALWAKHKIYSAALTAQPLTTQHIHSTTTQKQQTTAQTRAQPLKAHLAILKTCSHLQAAGPGVQVQRSCAFFTHIIQGIGH